MSRDVRTPVQLRLGPGVLSKDSTEDSDILLSCEMKDESAFKPLPRNATFFRVRESRHSLHVRQQTQGPYHRLIAEGRLLLRCLWEGGLLFNKILGISSLLELIGVHGDFLEFLC